MADARPRRGYLDWLRGVAVVVMIQGHVIDSWTAAADRTSREFGWTLVLGGLGGPLFLLLAGISTALSAASKARATGDTSAAARAVVRRGLMVFGLAFLFRLQAWILSGGSVHSLLRVDILNIMGLSIAAAGAIWGALATTRGRCGAFAAAAAAATLLTPPIRSAAALSVLPPALEAYLRPVPGLTNFVLFPWAGFVFAGALLGVLIAGVDTDAREARLSAAIGLACGVLALGAYAGSYLPSIYDASSFWTSSPSYFAMRVGILGVAVAASYAWSRRPGTARWSPLRQLGRTSLFIYWIHVEMVYGELSRPLHGALSLRGAWLALAAFTVLMLGLSVAKDRLVGPTALRSIARR